MFHETATIVYTSCDNIKIKKEEKNPKKQTNKTIKSFESAIQTVNQPVVRASSMTSRPLRLLKNSLESINFSDKARTWWDDRQAISPNVSETVRFALQWQQYCRTSIFGTC